MGIGGCDAELVVGTSVGQPDELEATVGVDIDQIAIGRSIGPAGEYADAAVVVAADGTELARAANVREATGDPTGHAEIVALRAAARVLGDGWRLEGATLAVTVEPCTVDTGCYRWVLRDPDGRDAERSAYSFATRQGARISGDFWARSVDAETTG